MNRSHALEATDERVENLVRRMRLTAGLGEVDAVDHLGWLRARVRRTYRPATGRAGVRALIRQPSRLSSAQIIRRPIRDRA